MIVRRAQKEEKGNEKHVEERIKRAARLLKGQEGEADTKESTDEMAEDEEEDVGEEEGDGDNEVDRQEKIDRLLGELSESRSKSIFSNPRLVALRQRRLKLLLGEDSDSSISDSETSCAADNITRSSDVGNLPSQSEPVLDGPNPGPSREQKTSERESLNQEEGSRSPSKGPIGCNLRLPESDTKGHSSLDDLSEAGPSGTSDGSGSSRVQVHFKKPGSQAGGRCIRKRSHDED